MSAALRLETFAPAAAQAARGSISLAEHERALARARSEAHAQGFEAGAAEALARSEAELNLLLSGLAEQLQDLHLKAAEARAEAERGALALMRGVLEAVSPALARQGLAAEIAERIAAILSRASRAREPRLRLAVAPDMAAPLARLIEARGLSLPGLDIEADPALTGFTARLDWAGGSDLFDTGAAIEAVRDILDRHAERLAAGPLAEAG